MKCKFLFVNFNCWSSFRSQPSFSRLLTTEISLNWLRPERRYKENIGILHQIRGCRRKPERTLSVSPIFVFRWHLSPPSLSRVTHICKNAGRWPPDGDPVSFSSTPSQLSWPSYLQPNLRFPGEAAWLVQLWSRSVSAPINYNWSNRRWRRVMQHQ